VRAHVAEAADVDLAGIDLEQQRGIAMRSDTLARNYYATVCLAATLHWLTSGTITR
jgi:hypothetical protein